MKKLKYKSPFKDSGVRKIIKEFETIRHIQEEMRSCVAAPAFRFNMKKCPSKLAINIEKEEKGEKDND